MRQWRNVTGGCVLLALALLVAGCATPLAGEQLPGQDVVYVRGGTQGNVPGSVEQVIETAEQVMAVLQMDVSEPEREGSEVGDVLKLNAHSASGQRVYVTATPVDAGTSQLRVRIGQFGNQQLSNELYRRIAGQLTQE